MKSPPRVFLVEDESLLALLLEDMLASLGFEVAGVAGGLEKGLAMADGIDCDLAVLDVNLGGEARSFPIADRLVDRGIPLVFVTGYGRSGLEGRYPHAPALDKPVSSGALRSALERAISAA